MTARALWTMAPGQCALREEPLGAPSDGEALVRTLWSGISRGTESLVFQGQVPEAEFDRMRCPMMGGAFPFPVKYGYSAVGLVEDGPAELAGRAVFALAPHQDRFIAPLSMLHPLPENLPPRRAVLAANMETALNIIWDASPLAGERAMVIGAGVVGLLVALLLSQVPAIKVTLVDQNPARAALAAALGLAFALADDAPGDQELVVHASGNPAGLALAIGRAANEARIIEASWFGEKPCAVPLGGAFHSRRLRLISTQVGQVAAPMRGRRTHAERLALALSLLDDAQLDLLLDGPTPFALLPAAMPHILGAPGALCHVVSYA
jgi:threonine dehydrogenase-like Zn-dependent dehydrogenase